jgi:hypothetical protein
MHKIIKKSILDWLLPPKIKDVMVSFYGLYNIKKIGIKNIYKNKQLKDIYKNKRCFILGNGPSINEVDLTKLKCDIVFVMSDFYIYDKHTDVEANYHTLVDIPDMVGERGKYERLKLISDLTSCNELIFGIKNKKIIEKYNLFKDKKIYYVASVPKISRIYDLSKITCSYMTNPLLTLEGAIYMGFNEIYLLGIEYNEVCNNEYKYFYGNDKIPYYSPEVESIDNGDMPILDMWESNIVAIREFDKINQYAKKQNLNIYNLSNQSTLKMFKYKKYEELFNE